MSLKIMTVKGSKVMLKWYEQNEFDNDIVISTRVRLARNLNKYSFVDRITESQQKEIIDEVTQVLKSANFGDNKLTFINLIDLSNADRISLAEKHLASYDFIKNPENKMLVLSEDNSISIMINEEDHLRIQVLQNGIQLGKAYELCDKIDSLLSQKLDFSYDEKFGYLTACPTNLGTGLRASLMLHLPALEKVGAIPQIVKATNNLGLAIRGSYGEGTQVSGSAYQLSNQVTLGLSEKSAIENLQTIAMQIIENEKKTRKELLKDNIKIKDSIYKSYGILKYSLLMPSEDFFEHISNVRLGISEQLIENVNISSINKLYNLVGAATVCSNAKKNFSATERDFNRAQIIRDML